MKVTVNNKLITLKYLKIKMIRLLFSTFVLICFILSMKLKKNCFDFILGFFLLEEYFQMVSN